MRRGAGACDVGQRIGGWTPETKAGSGSPPHTQKGSCLPRPMASTTALTGLFFWPRPPARPPFLTPTPTPAPTAPSHLWGWIHDTGFPSCAVVTWLLRRCFQEEVSNPLNQEIAVFKVGKQEGHFVLGANRQRAGQDTGTVGFFDNGHLGRQKHWVSVSCDTKTERFCDCESQVAAGGPLWGGCGAWMGHAGPLCSVPTLWLAAVSYMHV